MSANPWANEALCRRCFDMWRDGESASIIAKTLNREFRVSLSRNSVIGKIHRSGKQGEGRNSPGAPSRPQWGRPKGSASKIPPSGEGAGVPPTKSGGYEVEPEAYEPTQHSARGRVISPPPTGGADSVVKAWDARANDVPVAPLNVEIEALRRGLCRWPTAMRGVDQLYCGHPCTSVKGRPHVYCAHHRSVATGDRSPPASVRPNQFQPEDYRNRWRKS